ncbi:hypothetical protein MAJ_00003, partial [Metarhizium majus ARSEF 297]
MDKEDFFRQKSKSAEIQIKRLNRENASLKEQLQRKTKAMDAQDRRLDTLGEALNEAKQRAEQEARRRDESSTHLGQKLQESQHESKRDESSTHLGQKLQESQHESKRYRTALAAAFKLIDDLKDKTTLAELLAQTDQQLSGGAPKQEPETSAAASPEDNSDECYIRRPVTRKYRRGSSATPRRPSRVKRQREGEWSSEDSDERPLAKARKLRILRNITPHE